MKQQDIAIIAVIVIVVGCASFFVSSKFITPSDEKIKAEKVAPISAEFPIPDSKYFNKESSFNPTVRIQIGPTDNDAPFTGGDGSGQQ